MPGEGAPPEPRAAAPRSWVRGHLPSSPQLPWGVKAVASISWVSKLSVPSASFSASNDYILAHLVCVTLNFPGRDKNNAESFEISRIILGIHANRGIKGCLHCIKGAVLVNCPDVLQGTKRQGFKHVLHIHPLAERRVSG